MGDSVVGAGGCGQRLLRLGRGESGGNHPREVPIDPGGRTLLPESVGDALGLVPGSNVDISPYGPSVQITLGGRTARLDRDTGGRLVARSETFVTDEVMFSSIDSGRH